VDALPQAGRRYDREVQQVSAEGDAAGADEAELEIATPLPDLFRRPR
jgi:hypothetical protein